MIRDANGYLGLGNVTPEDISGLFGTPRYLMLRWNVREWDKEDAIELIKQTGYTPEDAVVDHEQFEVAPPTPTCEISRSPSSRLRWRQLGSEDPGDRIEYPAQVIDPVTGEMVSYPLATISLLNYFGAAYTDSNGYILVPDGSGALIYTNNGKTDASLYNRRVYGTDYAQQPIPEFTTVELGQRCTSPSLVSKITTRHFWRSSKREMPSPDRSGSRSMRDSYNKVWASFDFIRRFGSSWKPKASSSTSASSLLTCTKHARTKVI